MNTNAHVTLGFHDLESLVGKLQHASRVVKPGRSFCVAFLSFSQVLTIKPRHRVPLGEAARSDIIWWDILPVDWEDWNGVHGLYRRQLGPRAVSP